MIPAGGHDVSDHLDVSSHVSETTLLSSHRVYTPQGRRRGRPSPTPAYVQTRSPRCRAPVSSSPQARPSCRAPFSSLRPAGACKCSPRRHLGPRRPEGHCDRQAQLRDPHVLHLVLDDHHRVGRLPLVHLMREAIRAYQRQNRGHQRPTEAIRGHQRPSVAIKEAISACPSCTSKSISSWICATRGN